MLFKKYVWTPVNPAGDVYREDPAGRLSIGQDFSRRSR